MRKLQLLFLLFISTTVWGQENTEQVIQKVWNAIGGRAKWEQARFVKFTYAVENDSAELFSRNHTYDRYTGFYRLESTRSDGKKLLSLFNVNTKEGNCYIDTIKQDDSTSLKQLEKAYASFINDTYWLLLPAKLEDPGVHVASLPDTTIDNIAHHVLHLYFDDGIGLTPKDQYWVYVNSKSGEVARWDYVLQNSPDERATFIWQPYVNTGILKLSAEKARSDEGLFIHFPVIETTDTMDESIFDQPQSK